MNNPFPILTVLLIFLVHQAALPVNSPEIISDEVVLNFPESLIFRLEIDSEEVIDRVTLVYSSDGRSCQPGNARKDLEFFPGKELELEWEWNFSQNGTIPPGVIIEWQWEITDSLGNVTLTDPKTILIQDQRYEWEQISRDGITLQWFAGGEAFGEDLYAIAFAGREQVIDLLGIEFDEDVWITVYPSSEDVRDALKFNTQWTGGIAFTDHNAMIVPGVPGQEEWLNQVIPHEFAHFIAESYIHNCKGNWMPVWFEEGLAEYAESDLDQYDLDLIQSAYEEERLPALGSLVTSFSFDSEQAHTDYAVSKSVFYFLVQEFGSQKMGALLDQFQAGKMIDPALEQVYGFDTNGLEAAWRRSYGLSYGNEAALTGFTVAEKTPIPTLALYTSVVEASPTAKPIPELTVEAVPSPTPEAERATQAAQSSLPDVAGNHESPLIAVEEQVPNQEVSISSLSWIILLIVVSGGILVTAIIYLLRRVSR
jgi:hypothetical protein